MEVDALANRVSHSYNLRSCSAISEWRHSSQNTTFDPSRVYESSPYLWFERIAKPTGLWLSEGAEWEEWCQRERFDKDVPFTIWKMNIGAPRTIKWIRTLEQFDAFCLQYGYIPHGSRTKEPIQCISNFDKPFEEKTFSDFVWDPNGEWEPVQPVHLLSLDEMMREESKQRKLSLATEEDFWEEMAWFMHRCQQLRNETKCEYPFHLRWDLIMNEYAGLMVVPYLYERRHISWYYGWDVSSGVIWDLQQANVTQSE